jgi:hypothetical protein
VCHIASDRHFYICYVTNNKLELQVQLQVFQRLRRSVAGLSPQRTRVAPSSVHVWFVVGHWDRSFSEFFGFPLSISSEGWAIGPLLTTAHTPLTWTMTTSAPCFYISVTVKDRCHVTFSDSSSVCILI